MTKPKKIFILAYKKEYQGNRTNKKWAWNRAIELLGKEDNLSISYEVDGEPLLKKIDDATYNKLNALFKDHDKLIVHHSDDLNQMVTVWQGILNEG